MSYQILVTKPSLSLKLFEMCILLTIAVGYTSSAGRIPAMPYRPNTNFPDNKTSVIIAPSFSQVRHSATNTCLDCTWRCSEWVCLPLAGFSYLYNARSFVRSVTRRFTDYRSSLSFLRKSLCLGNNLMIAFSCSKIIFVCNKFVVAGRKICISWQILPISHVRQRTWCFVLLKYKKQLSLIHITGMRRTNKLRRIL